MPPHFPHAAPPTVGTDAPVRPSPRRARVPDRVARPRHLLMVPPSSFDVRVRVNPWMQPEVAVDRARAQRQWQALHDLYVALGHTVEVVPAVDGLDDMVFAANAAVISGGRALLSRMRDPHRAAETDAWEAWLASRGVDTVRSTDTFEGEGDVVRVGAVMVCAEGPRTARAARTQLAAVFGVEVVGVELVDPRWYHLDTAMFALDDHTVAWHPPAFSAASQCLLRRRWPSAVEIGEADAMAFGGNGVSDGRNVVLPAGAVGLARDLENRGWEPHLVDLSELLLSGGAVKCCTLEVHP